MVKENAAALAAEGTELASRVGREALELLQAIGSFQLKHGACGGSAQGAVEGGTGMEVDGDDSAGVGGGGAAAESSSSIHGGAVALEVRIAEKRSAQAATLARLREIVGALPGAENKRERGSSGSGGGGGGGKKGSKATQASAEAEKQRLIAEVTTVNGHLQTAIAEVREIVMDVSALQPLSPVEDGVRTGRTTTRAAGGKA